MSATRTAALLDEAAKNAQILERTMSIGLAALEQQTLPGLIRFVTNELRERMGCEHVTLQLLDPDGRLRHLMAILGESANQLTGCFVDSIDSLYIEKTTTRPWLSPYKAELHARLFPDASGIYSAAVIPLRSHHKLTGLLAVSSADEQRFAENLATDFLRFLGALIAAAVENQINAAELMRAGVIDPLTGLYNRRYLDARLLEQINSCREENQPLSCLAIDADHFKKINDSYGHPAGDVVLKGIAQTLRESLKPRDVAARLGGEEFVVIATGLTKQATIDVAERLRMRIEARNFVIHGQEAPVRATVSIGAAWVEPRSVQLDASACANRALAEADAALYDAKTGGRNRVNMREI